MPDFYGICAGLFEPPFSNFWDDTESDGYKQVEVNVSHPIKLTRLAIRKSLGREKRASVCIIVSRDRYAPLAVLMEIGRMVADEDGLRPR